MKKGMPVPGLPQDTVSRKRPARKPFPEHLPRERVIVPGPTTFLRVYGVGEDGVTAFTDYGIEC
jgi:hypothetical protein